MLNVKLYRSLDFHFIKTNQTEVQQQRNKKGPSFGENKGVSVLNYSLSLSLLFISI
jgi:hypothetical protein